MNLRSGEKKGEAKDGRQKKKKDRNKVGSIVPNSGRPLSAPLLVRTSQEGHV